MDIREYETVIGTGKTLYDGKQIEVSVFYGNLIIMPDGRKGALRLGKYQELLDAFYALHPDDTDLEKNQTEDPDPADASEGSDEAEPDPNKKEKAIWSFQSGGYTDKHTVTMADEYPENTGDIVENSAEAAILPKAEISSVAREIPGEDEPHIEKRDDTLSYPVSMSSLMEKTQETPDGSANPETMPEEKTRTVWKVDYEQDRAVQFEHSQVLGRLYKVARRTNDANNLQNVVSGTSERNWRTGLIPLILLASNIIILILLVLVILGIIPVGLLSR
jgi:hypothetical protein